MGGRRRAASRGAPARTSPIRALRKSCPAQLMEAIIIDPVEVGDLVDEGRVDLVAQLVLRVALGKVRFPEDDDAIGELADAVALPLGERPAVIQPEEVEA